MNFLHRSAFKIKLPTPVVLFLQTIFPRVLRQKEKNTIPNISKRLYPTNNIETIWIEFSLSLSLITLQIDQFKQFRTTTNYLL